VADGLLYGNPRQLLIQAAAVLAAMVYSGLGTYVILKLVGLVSPLRTAAREEGLGLDVSEHGESAYARGEGAILVLPEVAATPVAAAVGQLKPEGGRA
jgi:Amt family ammonium transporter